MNKYQLIYRLTMVFLITVVIGFIVGDINVHSQMDSQTVTDLR